MSELMPKEQAVRDVRVLAGRLALLYRCFCEEIEKELGQTETKALVRRVVDAYGFKCGQDVRKTIDELGLAAEAGNYSKGQDLPSVGWEMEPMTGESDEVRVRVHYCPLATVWKSIGQSDYDRLYCYVDQAKYSSYNSELECVHLQNCLDGDKICELVVHNKNK